MWIVVYDILGREATVLVDETLSAGVRAVPFDASNLAAGTYLIRMHAGSFSATRQVTVLR